MKLSGVKQLLPTKPKIHNPSLPNRFTYFSQNVIRNKSMTDQILDYFGKSHASHIHARGKVSTIKLIELLEVNGNDKILEIGFGTGATLVQIAARSKADIFGYETSKVMFQKALKRIRFCKMSERINITLVKKKNHFPVPDSTFDRVYCESIIAIQEDDDFLNLLLEIKRVLKPTGSFVLNIKEKAVDRDFKGNITIKNVDEDSNFGNKTTQAIYRFKIIGAINDWQRNYRTQSFHLSVPSRETITKFEYFSEWLYSSQVSMVSLQNSIFK